MNAQSSPDEKLDDEDIGDLVAELTPSQMPNNEQSPQLPEAQVVEAYTPKEPIVDVPPTSKDVE